MFSSLSNPDLVVYLYSNIDRLQKNIQKRGRVFEKEISNEYLQNIQQKYLDFLNKQNMFPVLILNVSEVDFIENKRVYQKIKSLINSKYDIGVHRFNLS